MSNPGFCSVTPILCVTDLVESLKYYEKVLGFDVAWKWSENSEFENPNHPTFACVCRGDCILFLSKKGQGNPGSWVALNVHNQEELQELYEQHQNCDANIVEEPQDYSWGMREMIVKDLDGNTFRMGCPVKKE